MGFAVKTGGNVVSKHRKAAVLAAAAACASVTLPLSLAGEAQASSTYTVGFANEATTAPFQISVQNGMVAAAKAAHDKLIALNNNYDDATALRNAQILANDKVNIAVEFQVDAKIAPAIAATFAKAHIPAISIDIPQPGATFFGASNYADGELTGQRLGKYAKAHGWKPATTTEVLLSLPAAGAIPQLRMNGMQDGIAQEFPGIPKSQIIEQDGSGATAASQTVMASILPRIPTGNHIILVAINDESAQGGLRAIQVAGRESSTIVGAQGADNVGIQEIKTDSHWIGDTGYFPEFYGKYIFQLIKDKQEGKPVTKYVFVPRTFLDRANINQYYPGKATTAVKPPPGTLQFSKSPKKTL